jgi:hypothetical protein
MIKYFKELLETLKSIDAKLESIETGIIRLSSCVMSKHHSHGDSNSLSTKHWND